MIIVRLGGPSPKVTEDYRGFRKGVYVRVTEVNPELEDGLQVEVQPPIPVDRFLSRPSCRRHNTACFRGYGRSRSADRKSRRINGPRMVVVLPIYLHLRHAQGGEEMGTIWDSGNQGNENRADAGKLSQSGKPAHEKEVARIGRDARLRWSRAQKLSAVACFALLAVLLIVNACSKEEQKPALAGVGSASNSDVSAAQTTAPSSTAMAASEQPPSAASKPKKARRKLAANVTYRDANSGVSFVYPRKAALASAEKAQAASAGADDLPMNFVQSGGSPVATVVLPRAQYAGTDFTAGVFRVNVNRSLSAEECPHFAFVDTSDPDGEPIDAEKVKVGSTEMETTSEFAGDAGKQLETRYYHAYENGACYEYVLGLSTAGFGQEGVQSVDRDQVFARLEKILTSVKIRPVAGEQVAQKQDLPKEDAQKQMAEEPAAASDSDK